MNVFSMKRKYIVGKELDMKRVGYLWVLIAFCLFTTRPSLAWWTVLYPQAVNEATIEERSELTEIEKENSLKKTEELQEETSEEFEIRWKLAEWFVKWF